MLMKRVLFVLILSSLVGILALTPQSLRAEEPEAEGFYDDDFNSSTLNSKWHWIRETPTHWSLTTSPGYLRIITQRKDIWQSHNSAPLLLQPAPMGDFDIITKVTMSPTANYQQGGLVMYENDDNYIRLTYAYISGRKFEFGKEVGGVFQKFQVPAPTDDSFYLRIVKSGQDFLGYYRQSGGDWVLIGEHSNVNISVSQIGLSAFNAQYVTHIEIPADFDFFRVTQNASPISPFMQLPYDYTGSTFIGESKDTEQGGKIDAYFDHQYPTYCQLPNTGGCVPGNLKAVNFRGYDGGQSGTQPPYKIQYNGHDGTDYLLTTGTSVFAVASGTVSEVVRNAPLAGNKVVVEHYNGYRTEYWHLSKITTGIQVGSVITRELVNDQNALIGEVGETGNATGPHLHFIVWNPSNVKIDPYGWNPKPDAYWYGEVDPWIQRNVVDATSHYLWLHLIDIFGPVPASGSLTLTSLSGQIVVTVPSEAYDGPLQIELSENLSSPLIPKYRTLSSFTLFGITTNEVEVISLDADIDIEFHVSATNTSVQTPTIQIWDTTLLAWQRLPTTWSPSTRVASATTTQLGAYALTIPEYSIYLPLIQK